MQAILTAEALDFIPAAIRQKLKLQKGTVLEFDEEVPFLKAVPTFSVDDMMSCIGVAKGRYDGMTTDEFLTATRGEAEA